MKVTGLDGKPYVWTPKHKTNHEKKSKIHLRARYLLQKVWPSHVILEEVHLAGTSLFADFVIFGSRVIVEVHGEQHFAYNTMFHSSQADFVQQKQRDSDKEHWCELNGFQYIVFPHWESDDEWRARLYQTKTG